MFHYLLQNEYILALVLIGGSVLIGALLHFTIRKYIKAWADKTKTHLDDFLLAILTKPLYIFIIFTGIFLAMRALSFFNPYQLWITRVYYVIVVVLAATALAKVMSVFMGHWLKVHKRYENTPRLINKVVTIIIYLIAFLMILGYFDVKITPLLATLGIGGLAVGLALQNTLSNFFAGLHIITDRPVNVGDFVELDGGAVSGYVEDIGWRSTRIRTLPNTIVVVPNSKLAESTIINDSLPEHEMAALLQCGVSYDSDLEKVEKVTTEVATHIQKTVPGAVKKFEPFIRYHTFGDSNINFTIILRVEKLVDKYLVTHEMIKALKKRYDKEGIEISWPVRKIYQAK